MMKVLSSPCVDAPLLPQLKLRPELEVVISLATSSIQMPLPNIKKKRARAASHNDTVERTMQKPTIVIRNPVRYALSFSSNPFLKLTDTKIEEMVSAIRAVAGK